MLVWFCVFVPEALECGGGGDRTLRLVLPWALVLRSCGMVRPIPSVLLVLGTGSCFCCVVAIPFRCLLVRQVCSRLFCSWSSTSLFLRFRPLGRVGGSSQLFPGFIFSGSCELLARGCDECILLSGDPLLVAANGSDCCILSEGTRPEGAGDSDCSGLKSSASAYPFSASIFRSIFFLLRHSA